MLTDPAGVVVRVFGQAMSDPTRGRGEHTIAIPPPPFLCSVTVKCLCKVRYMKYAADYVHYLAGLDMSPLYVQYVCLSGFQHC